MSLHGDEALNLVLRLLTSIEIFLNHDKHLGTFRSLACDFKESFSNEVDFIAMLLHFSVTENITSDTDMFDIFTSEAILITQPGSFSSMASIYALSNVIGCRINSVYSPRASKLFPLFTRVIGNESFEASKTIQILWCNTKIDFTQPNHFVFCTTDTNYLTSLTSITALSQSIKVDTLECRKRTKQSKLNFTIIPDKRSKPTQLTSTSTPIQGSLQTSSASILQHPSTKAVESYPTVQSTNHSTQSTSHSTQSTSHSTQSTSQSTQLTSQSTQSTSQSTQSTSHSIQSISQSTQPTSNSIQSTSQAPFKNQTKQSVRNYPVKPAIECHPNDIGLVMQRIDKMTDNEKIEYLDTVWKPPSDFAFPFHTEFGRRWRFNNSYLAHNSTKYFNWLVYSAYHDDVYCLPCVLFGKKDQTKLKMLLTEPLNRWNAMATKFRDHQTKSPIHKMSIGVMQSLLSEKTNEKQPIDMILNKQVSKQVTENREKLVPIIKTVLFCARQNIPLRGHRDDANHLDEKTNNPGNFQELLKFRIDSGDKVLESHLKNCAKNARYRSKTIQNEIIVSAANLIRSKIANEIKDCISIVLHIG